MIIEAKIEDNWQISKFANLKLVLCELWKGTMGNKKRGCPKSLKKYDCATHFVKLSKFDKVNCSDNQSLLFTL